MSAVKFLDDGKYLAAGEYVSYLNIYNTNNYYLKTEIDYFGQLLGLDTIPGLRNKLYLGLAHFYEDVRGGILEVNIGPDL